MQIQWYGQSYFKIQAKNNKGESINIVTDPFGNGYGLKVPKTQADIVTISHNHKDHNNLSAINGDCFVVSDPGEYETRGVFIYGISSWHDDKQGAERGINIIYRIQTEDLVIVHLGDLGHKPTDDQLDKIGDVDILMIPVGGKYTIDAKKAKEIISEIEPRIIIPMHYKIPNLKTDIDNIDKFIKETGLPTENTDKFKISKKDIIAETEKIVILNK